MKKMLVGILCLTAARALAEHWTYDGEHGPEYWSRLSPEYATCGDGKRQSPIDIRGAEKADLPPIAFAYTPSRLKIVDNGHTIQVNYAPGSSITVGNKKYELVQFHFHKPSEESVNGRHSAMVAHLVHKDADGKLAVVAVLLEEGASNPLIETLWKHLPAEKENEVAVEGVEIDASTLLPRGRGYYTFDGSLTTPPCSEGVTWFVLETPTQVSQAEVSEFGTRYAHNARPTQPVNGRVVRQSR